MTNDEAKELGVQFDAVLEITANRQPTSEQAQDLDELGVRLMNAVDEACDKVFESIGWDKRRTTAKISGAGASGFSGPPTTAGNA